MKKTYIHPETIALKIHTASFIATSGEADVKGEFSDANETENGGAGILSRQQEGLWEDE